MSASQEDFFLSELVPFFFFLIEFSVYCLRYVDGMQCGIVI